MAFETIVAALEKIQSGLKKDIEDLSNKLEKLDKDVNRRSYRRGSVLWGLGFSMLMALICIYFGVLVSVRMPADVLSRITFGQQLEKKQGDADSKPQDATTSISASGEADSSSPVLLPVELPQEVDAAVAIAVKDQPKAGPPVSPAIPNSQLPLSAVSSQQTRSNRPKPPVF